MGCNQCPEPSFDYLSCFFPFAFQARGPLNAACRPRGQRAAHECRQPVMASGRGIQGCQCRKHAFKYSRSHLCLLNCLDELTEQHDQVGGARLNPASCNRVWSAQSGFLHPPSTKSFHYIFVWPLHQFPWGAVDPRNREA